MSYLPKLATSTVLVACAFCVTAAGANSIPYHSGPKATKGLADFQPDSHKTEKPFATVLYLTKAKKVKTVHNSKGSKHKHERDNEDEHTANGDDHTGHNDWNDSQEDSASYTPLPLVLPSYIPVTASPSAVPLPAALWLFLSGIIGLGVTGAARRR